MGIVGFTHIEGSWKASVIFVRGKRSYEINLVYPLYYIIKTMWKFRVLQRNRYMRRKYNVHQ